MASPTRTLTVNFVGRTENLDKAYKRVSKGSALMSDKLVKATRMAGIGVAALGGAVATAAATLKPMIDKAADVSESLSKNTVVFGDAAAGVEKFAETAATSLGMSRREALEATGQFGALAAAMKLPQKQGAEMATTMTALAADMASFNNASPEETLLALQSGLRGEAEPLRRFGVLLDAATLKAKALEEGLIDNQAKALTPVQKALAAYSVILEQTAVQQGDFERTSDGLANQQRILASNFDDLQVSVGEALLPALESLVSFMNANLIPALADFVADPSVEQAGRSAGRIWGAAFAEGANEGPSEGDSGDSFLDKIIRASVRTAGPIGLLPLYIKMGADFAGGFLKGVEDSGFEQRLAAIIERTGGHGPNFARGGGGGAPPGSGHPASPATLPANRLPGGGRIPGGFEVAPAKGSYTEFSPPSFTTADDLDAFYASMGIHPTRPPAGSGHPAAAPVTVNVSGVVSGQEVVDAIGEFVDTNGPLPDWWTQ